MKITDVKVTPPLGVQNRNWVLMKVCRKTAIQARRVTLQLICRSSDLI